MKTPQTTARTVMVAGTLVTGWWCTAPWPRAVQITVSSPDSMAAGHQGSSAAGSWMPDGARASVTRGWYSVRTQEMEAPAPRGGYGTGAVPPRRSERPGAWSDRLSEALAGRSKPGNRNSSATRRETPDMPRKRPGSAGRFIRDSRRAEQTAEHSLIPNRRAPIRADGQSH